MDFLFARCIIKSMKESNEQNIIKDKEMPLESAQGREDAVELTPEEIERFEKILPKTTYSMFSFSSFNRMRIWKSFKSLFDNVNFEYKMELLKTRQDWFEMKKGGNAFEKFLEDKIRELLNNQTSDDSGYSTYRLFLVYEGLDYKNSVDFSSEILDQKRVWADGDGSMIHEILSFFRASQDPKAKDAIIRYIEHALSEDYNRKNFLSSDLTGAAYALKDVLGESAKDVFEELAEKDKTFAGWFEKKKLGLLSEKSLVEPKKKTFDEFDEKKEEERLRQLEIDIDVLPEKPEKFDDNYDDYGYDYDDNYDELSDDNYVLPEKRRQKEIELKELETPEVKKERERFPGVRKVVVKGSVAYAFHKGREMSLARDVDFYFVRDDSTDEVVIETFADLNKAREKLLPQEYDALSRFMENAGIEKMEIQVVRASKKVLDEVGLFEDEPEVVVWDPVFEARGKKADAGLSEQKTAAGGGGSVEDFDAASVRLYKEGRLMRGKVPDYLRPASKRLAVSLRLVDLGERFGIPVDDYILQTKDYAALDGTLRIAVPRTNDDSGTSKEVLRANVNPFEEEDKEENEESDAYFGAIKEKSTFPLFQVEQSDALDLAFYNVAVNKPGVLALMEKRYSNLAGIVKRIKDAGGLKEFIAKEYGDFYLKRQYFNLNDPSLAGYSLPEEEQERAYNIWSSYSTQMKLFSGPKDFFESYSALNSEAPFLEMSTSDILKRLMKPRVEHSLRPENKDAGSRIRAYSVLFNAYGSYQHESELEGQKRYQAEKEEIKDYFTKEKNKKVRAFLVKKLVSFANNKCDYTIITDFAELIRKESIMMKGEKKEKKRILSEEGMLMLRALFETNYTDGNKAIFNLIAHSEVDPRLKQACLRNLVNQKRFFPNNSFVREDAEKQPRKVEWDDYGALQRVEAIASTTIRDRLRPLSYRAASDIRRSGKGIVQANRERAEKLPPEFFLPLQIILRDNPELLRDWETLISSIKSNKLQESFLYNLSNMIPFDSEMSELVTEKIISSKQPTKEHAFLADRLLKKIHFMIVLKDQMTRLSRSSDSRQGLQALDIQKLLEESKVPSLLESSIDQQMVTGLYELTGREDLTSDKIQSLFKAWDDPEPIFLYTAELARQSVSRFGEQEKKTLNLVGEMLSHMDPPDFQDWKQWRYFSEDPFAKEQLKNLSEDQIEAYAEDEFTDLGDVLVGLLPSDKPRRVREEIIHAFSHENPEGEDRESRSPLRFAKSFRSALRSGAFDAESVLEKNLQEIERKMQSAEQWLTLADDRTIAEKLPEQLKKWQDSEVEKREALRTLGFRGDETRKEIEDALVAAKNEKNQGLLSKLAKLKPGELPEKIQNFLGRYGVPASASTYELNKFSEDIKRHWEEEVSSEPYIKFSEESFGRSENINPAEWQALLAELKAVQTFLRLGNLTPQLIAYNRLVPGKKKATLQKGIEYVKHVFREDQELRGAVERIQSIIAEESRPVDKDRLAVIFTDNPLALLTVGRFPSGAESCQKYTNGSSALGSYMADASTKMCMLVDINKLPEDIKKELEEAETNEKKLKIFQNHTFAFLTAMVGRRLTKIVRETRGFRPQIFLEPAYTPLNLQSTTRLLNAYAVTHLQPRMGLELVRGGGSFLVAVAESRNHIQYEDGESGGPANGGMGTMSGIYEMAAQALKKTDYLIS